MAVNDFGSWLRGRGFSTAPDTRALNAPTGRRNLNRVRGAQSVSLGPGVSLLPPPPPPQAPPVPMPLPQMPMAPVPVDTRNYPDARALPVPMPLPYDPLPQQPQAPAPTPQPVEPPIEVRPRWEKLFPGEGKSDYPEMETMIGLLNDRGAPATRMHEGGTAVGNIDSDLGSVFRRYNSADPYAVAPKYGEEKTTGGGGWIGKAIQDNARLLGIKPPSFGPEQVTAGATQIMEQILINPTISNAIAKQERERRRDLGLPISPHLGSGRDFLNFMVAMKEKENYSSAIQQGAEGRVLEAAMSKVLPEHEWENATINKIYGGIQRNFYWADVVMALGAGIISGATAGFGAGSSFAMSQALRHGIRQGSRELMANLAFNAYENELSKHVDSSVELGAAGATLGYLLGRGKSVGRPRTAGALAAGFGGMMGAGLGTQVPDVVGDIAGGFVAGAGGWKVSEAPIEGLLSRGEALGNLRYVPGGFSSKSQALVKGVVKGKGSMPLSPDELQRSRDGYHILNTVADDLERMGTREIVKRTGVPVRTTKKVSLEQRKRMKKVIADYRRMAKEAEEIPSGFTHGELSRYEKKAEKMLRANLNHKLLDFKRSNLGLLTKRAIAGNPNQNWRDYWELPPETRGSLEQRYPMEEGRILEAVDLEAHVRINRYIKQQVRQLNEIENNPLTIDESGRIFNEFNLQDINKMPHSNVEMVETPFDEALKAMAEREINPRNSVDIARIAEQIFNANTEIAASLARVVHHINEVIGRTRGMSADEHLKDTIRTVIDVPTDADRMVMPVRRGGPTAVKPPPIHQGIRRSPWLYTKTQFQNFYKTYPTSPWLKELGERGLLSPDGKPVPDAHERLVSRALNENQPVPPEILVDYPDLMRQAGLPEGYKPGDVVPGVFRLNLEERVTVNALTHHISNGSKAIYAISSKGRNPKEYYKTFLHELGHVWEDSIREYNPKWFTKIEDDIFKAVQRLDKWELEEMGLTIREIGSWKPGDKWNRAIKELFAETVSKHVDDIMRNASTSDGGFDAAKASRIINSTESGRSLADFYDFIGRVASSSMPFAALVRRIKFHPDSRVRRILRIGLMQATENKSQLSPLNKGELSSALDHGNISGTIEPSGHIDSQGSTSTWANSVILRRVENESVDIGTDSVTGVSYKAPDLDKHNWVINLDQLDFHSMAMIPDEEGVFSGLQHLRRGTWNRYAHTHFGLDYLDDAHKGGMSINPRKIKSYEDWEKSDVRKRIEKYSDYSTGYIVSGFPLKFTHKTGQLEGSLKINLTADGLMEISDIRLTGGTFFPDIRTTNLDGPLNITRQHDFKDFLSNYKYDVKRVGGKVTRTFIKTTKEDSLFPDNTFASDIFTQLKVLFPQTRAIYGTRVTGAKSYGKSLAWADMLRPGKRGIDYTDRDIFIQPYETAQGYASRIERGDKGVRADRVIKSIENRMGRLMEKDGAPVYEFPDLNGEFTASSPNVLLRLEEVDGAIYIAQIMESGTMYGDGIRQVLSWLARDADAYGVELRFVVPKELLPFHADGIREWVRGKNFGLGHELVEPAPFPFEGFTDPASKRFYRAVKAGEFNMQTKEFDLGNLLPFEKEGFWFSSTQNWKTSHGVSWKKGAFGTGSYPREGLPVVFGKRVPRPDKRRALVEELEWGKTEVDRVRKIHETRFLKLKDHYEDYFQNYKVQDPNTVVLKPQPTAAEIHDVLNQWTVKKYRLRDSYGGWGGDMFERKFERMSMKTKEGMDRATFQLEDSTRDIVRSFKDYRRWVLTDVNAREKDIAMLNHLTDDLEAKGLMARNDDARVDTSTGEAVDAGEQNRRISDDFQRGEDAFNEFTNRVNAGEEPLGVNNELGSRDWLPDAENTHVSSQDINEEALMKFISTPENRKTITEFVFKLRDATSPEQMGMYIQDIDRFNSFAERVRYALASLDLELVNFPQSAAAPDDAAIWARRKIEDWAYEDEAFTEDTMWFTHMKLNDESLEGIVSSTIGENGRKQVIVGPVDSTNVLNIKAVGFGLPRDLRGIKNIIETMGGFIPLTKMRRIKKVRKAIIAAEDSPRSEADLHDSDLMVGMIGPVTREIDNGLRNSSSVASAAAGEIESLLAMAFKDGRFAGDYKVFKVGKKLITDDGRIPDLAPWNPDGRPPTVQDVAAKYPLYRDHLSDDQVFFFERMREILEPYDELMRNADHIDLDDRFRKDITRVLDGNGNLMKAESGFYVPRGSAKNLAEIGLWDAGALDNVGNPIIDPNIIAKEIEETGIGGFGRSKTIGGLKTAQFNSMAEGLDAGYTYVPLTEAITSYITGARKLGYQDYLTRVIMGIRSVDPSTPIWYSNKSLVAAEYPALAQYVESIRREMNKVGMAIRSEVVKQGEAFDDIRYYADRVALQEADIDEDVLSSLIEAATKLSEASRVSQPLRTRLLLLKKQLSRPVARQFPVGRSPEFRKYKTKSQFQSISDFYDSTVRSASSIASKRSLSRINDFYGLDLEGKYFPSALRVALKHAFPPNLTPPPVLGRYGVIATYPAGEIPKELTLRSARVLQVMAAHNRLYSFIGATLDDSFIAIQGAMQIGNDIFNSGMGIRAAYQLLRVPGKDWQWRLADLERNYPSMTLLKTNAQIWNPLQFPDHARLLNGRKMAMFNQSAKARGMPTTDEWTAVGLRLRGQQHEYSISFAEKIPLISRANMAFGYTGDQTRLALAELELSLVMKKTGKTARQLRDDGTMELIAKQSNSSLGYNPSTGAYDIPSFLFFAPDFFMARFHNMVNMVRGLHPNAPADRRMAAKHTWKFAATAMTMVIGINSALGNETDLRPVIEAPPGRKQRFAKLPGAARVFGKNFRGWVSNPNFLNIRWEGRDYQPLGPYSTMMQLLYASAMGNVGAFSSVLSGTGATIRNIVTGETFFGESWETLEKNLSVEGVEPDPLVGPITGPMAYILENYGPFSFDDATKIATTFASNVVAKNPKSALVDVGHLGLEAIGTKSSEMSLTDYKDDVTRDWYKDGKLSSMYYRSLEPWERSAVTDETVRRNPDIFENRPEGIDIESKYFTASAMFNERFKKDEDDLFKAMDGKGPLALRIGGKMSVEQAKTEWNDLYGNYRKLKQGLKEGMSMMFDEELQGSGTEKQKEALKHVWSITEREDVTGKSGVKTFRFDSDRYYYYLTETLKKIKSDPVTLEYVWRNMNMRSNYPEKWFELFSGTSTAREVEIDGKIHIVFTAAEVQRRIRDARERFKDSLGPPPPTEWYGGGILETEKVVPFIRELVEKAK